MWPPWGCWEPHFSLTRSSLGSPLTFAGVSGSVLQCFLRCLEQSGVFQKSSVLLGCLFAGALGREQALLEAPPPTPTHFFSGSHCISWWLASSAPRLGFRREEEVQGSHVAFFLSSQGPWPVCFTFPLFSLLMFVLYMISMDFSCI